MNLISIIIPTYNRASLIRETLNSILSQSFSNWECIIVDDHSVDNTPEIALEYVQHDSRFKFFKRPDNLTKGPNSCRNFGFEQSNGDYIQWFDSDDVMYPELLERQLCNIKNSDLSVCEIEKYDFKNNIYLQNKKNFSNRLIEDYFMGNIAFYVSGPFWKRSFLEKQEELFDAKLRNLDDWDFNLRMIYQKPTFTFIKEVLIIYRMHNKSLSEEIKNHNISEIISEIKALKKHLNLLAYNKQANIVLLREHVSMRLKFFLREALILEKNSKYFLLEETLKMQFLSWDFIGIAKTVVGFFTYTIFKRGYKLL